MPIPVKTSVYEGPLEVLLELIEKRKLLINDIALAAVTDEYIARINSLPEIPVGETAEFISLAATLLLIKSRSLLPGITLTEDESRDITQLEYRLALYQLIKESSTALGKLPNGYLYEPLVREQTPLYIPDTSVTHSSLRAAAQTLLEGFPVHIVLPTVAVKKIISLEDMIENMAARISSAFTMNFKEFAGKKERTEVIVSFLALLELVKQGIIKAEQEAHYGDITLQAHAVSTPSYGNS
jgi:segregation and condensation protein A